MRSFDRSVLSSTYMVPAVLGETHVCVYARIVGVGRFKLAQSLTGQQYGRVDEWHVPAADTSSLHYLDVVVGTCVVASGGDCTPIIAEQSLRLHQHWRNNVPESRMSAWS